VRSCRNHTDYSDGVHSKVGLPWQFVELNPLHAMMCGPAKSLTSIFCIIMHQLKVAQSHLHERACVKPPLFTIQWRSSCHNNDDHAYAMELSARKQRYSIVTILVGAASSALRTITHPSLNNTIAKVARGMRSQVLLPTLNGVKVQMHTIMTK